MAKLPYSQLVMWEKNVANISIAMMLTEKIPGMVSVTLYLHYSLFSSHVSRDEGKSI